MASPVGSRAYSFLRKGNTRRDMPFSKDLVPLVKRIAASNGKALTEKETLELKSDINREKNPSQTINMLAKCLFPKDAPEKKASPEILSSLINHQTIPYGIKKVLFEELSLKDKTQGIYHDYIFAADRHDDFPTIQKTYQEMRSRNLISMRTYGIYIRVCARQGLLDEVEMAFNEAKLKNLANSEVYSHYINAIGRSSPFERIQSLYSEALGSEEKVDLLVCNAFIKQAGFHKKLNEAKDVFLRLREKWIADKATYTTFIKGAGINHRFDLAKEAFDEAIDYRFFDTRTFNCYIDIAGKAKKFEEADRAFKLAKVKRNRDAVTFICYINAASWAGKINEAASAFKEGRELFPDEPDLVTAIIRGAGEHGAFEEVIEAYRFQTLSLKFYPELFEQFIYAAGLNNRDKEAKEAFDLAERKNCCTTLVCSRYIDTAAACGNFDEAKRAFDLLIKIEQMDAIAVSRYLRVCAQFNRPLEADRCYQLSRKLNLTDKVIVSGYLEALNEFSELEKAETVFKEFTRNGVKDSSVNNSMLKVFSYGNEISKAELLFKEMLSSNAYCSVSFVIMINAYAYSSQFNKAKSLFELAKEKGCDDISVYAAFINAASETNQATHGIDAFNQARAKKYHSVKLYNCYMQVLGVARDINAVEETFRYIEKEFGPDRYASCSYISIMGNHGDIKKAEEAFEKGKKLFSSSKLYTAYMDVLRKKGRLQESMELFHEARRLGLAESRTYSCYINCNPPDLDEMAEEAIKANIGHADFYNSLIRVEADRGHFERMEEIFVLAKKRNQFNHITYSEVIYRAGSLGRFDFAAQTYEEAIARGIKDVRIFNNFMNAALSTKRMDLFESAYQEAKRLGVADTFTASIYIKAKIEEKQFDDAKLAFDEFAKKEADYVVYVNYMTMAGRAGNLEELKRCFNEAKARGVANGKVYSIYMDQLSAISNQIRKENRLAAALASSAINFDEAKAIFEEAKKRSFLSQELIVQYINCACKHHNLAEAEEGLLLLHEKGYSSDSVRQNVQNWKILYVLRPETQSPVISFLNNADLFTLSFPLWDRFKNRRRKEPSASVKNLPILPERLRNLTSIPMNIVNKDFQSPTTMQLKELFQSSSQYAAKKKINIDGGHLVGGAVGYCLDEEVYEAAFEECAASQSEPFWNAELKELLSILYKERFHRGPNDWDFKYSVTTNNLEHLRDLAEGFDLQLSASTGLNAAATKNQFAHKEAFINKDGNQFTLRRLVDETGNAIEIVWGTRFARSNLFISDALQISIDRITFKNSKKPVELKAVSGSVSDAAVHCLLKRLKATESETINEFGYLNYIAKLSSGSLGDDEKLEANAIIKLTENPDLLPIIESIRDSHLNKAPEGTLALLFNLCTLFVLNGYSMEAQNLLHRTRSLFHSHSKNPFYSALEEIWIKNSIPFMEIKAAIEAIALLSFPVLAKLDEHNGKQVLQFTYLNYTFILPFDPQNTLKALSLSSHETLLKKIIKTVPATLDHKTAKRLGMADETFISLNALADKTALLDAPATTLPVIEEPEPTKPSSSWWPWSWSLWRRR